jgi:hypothetical protein
MGHCLKSAALWLAILAGIWTIVGSASNPPAPAATQQHEMSVVLTHEPGQPWYVYKGLSADPGPGEHAVIDSLALPGSVSYSLSHDQDANAYFINPGEIYAFRGMPVAGSWTAQFSGNRAEAPASVQFTLRWK